jgi:hypothetical protein
MRVLHVSLAAAVAISALSGCTSNGALISQFAGPVTLGYNDVCVSQPGSPSIMSQLSALPMTSVEQSAFAKIQGMCAIGAPTNAAVAMVDGVSIYEFIQQYYPNFKLAALAHEVRIERERLHLTIQ